MMVLCSILRDRVIPSWRLRSCRPLLTMRFLSWAVVIIGTLTIMWCRHLLWLVAVVIIRLRDRS